MRTTLRQQHTTTAQDERRPVLSPVWREVAADLDTPVSAYLKLASGRYGYLLESSRAASGWRATPSSEPIPISCCGCATAWRRIAG